MMTRRFFDTPAWDFDVTKPFAEIERLRQRMDRLFDEWMPSTWKAGRTMGVFPLANLTEDRESYLLRAEIPGVKAEDLEIQATANSVSIAGERNIPQEEENVSYHSAVADTAHCSYKNEYTDLLVQNIAKFLKHESDDPGRFEVGSGGDGNPSEWIVWDTPTLENDTPTYGTD